MTPAIKSAQKNNIKHKVHQYTHNTSAVSYGLEAAEKMGVPQSQVFKTLVVMLDNNALAVAVIPVSHKLSLKLIAKAAGAKKAAMAAPKDVERTTGYVLGGVSPLGQKKHLKTFIDCSAQKCTSLFVSAGKRGLEIELLPIDLLALTQGVFLTITH